ncbi:UvrD-helicase domain-containing protein [Glutamicibacter sp.]|uniref:UvrD-helicase domain-containing protein n=1 Tax=Glutamicibacter sp. TaxID=1931995 RepID=UPI002FDA8CC2
MVTTKLVGPPGTGKTTWLLGKVKERIEDGADPSTIGYVAFSKAAIGEARERVFGHIRSEELHYWRTLHSMAFKALDTSTQQMFTTKDWIEFGRRYDYIFSVLATTSRRPVEPSNEADALMLAYHYGRSTMASDWRLVARTLGGLAREDDLVAFVKHLTSYKAEVGKIDFNDLLENAVNEKAAPVGLRHLFLDEAQDLTPLQWAYFRVIQEVSQPESVNAAADPAQCIYSFSGCDPELWNVLEADDDVVLRQSHRLPDQIVRFSRKITPDAVRFYGKPDEKDHIKVKVRWQDALDGLDGRRTFILCRSNWIVSQVAQDLAASKIDYTTRDDNDRYGQIRMVLGHLIGATKDGKAPYTVSAGTLADIVALMDARENKMPRGYKTQAEHEAVGNPGAAKNLKAEPWFRWWHMNLDAGRASYSFKNAYRWGIPRLLGLARLKGPEQLLKEPTVHVMTIHGAKGKEADKTILVPVLPKRVMESLHGFDDSAVQRNRANEARLHYVGCTRSKDELIIIDPYDPAFAALPAYDLPKKETEEEVEI